MKKTNKKQVSKPIAPPSCLGNCEIGDFVATLWVDAETDHGWKLLEDLKNDDDRIVLSFGFFVKRTDELVILAADCATQDPYGLNRFIFIPVVLIKAMARMKVTGSRINVA